MSLLWCLRYGLRGRLLPLSSAHQRSRRRQLGLPLATTRAAPPKATTTATTMGPTVTATSVLCLRVHALVSDARRRRRRTRRGARNSGTSGVPNNRRHQCHSRSCLQQRLLIVNLVLLYRLFPLALLLHHRHSVSLCSGRSRLPAFVAQDLERSLYLLLRPMNLPLSISLQTQPPVVPTTTETIAAVASATSALT